VTGTIRERIGRRGGLGRRRCLRPTIRGCAAVVLFAACSFTGPSLTSLPDNCSRDLAGRWIPPLSGGIVFQRTRVALPPMLLVVNPEDQIVVGVPTGPYGGEEPSVAPDGGRLAFKVGSVLCVLDRSRETLSKVHQYEGTIGSMSWSPDGTRITFAASQGFGSEIYVVGLDGSGLRALTAGGANDVDPAWSPDGSRIAFWRPGPGSEGGLFAIDPRQPGLPNPTRLHDSPDLAGRPDWSPDGTRLAVAGRSAVYIITRDGVVLHEITTPGPPSRASWSPDGTRLAVSVSGTIFVVFADGGELIPITSGSLADWGP